MERRSTLIKMSSSLYNKKYFRASRKFQQDKARLEALVAEIKRYKPVNVLDVGCGLGVVVRKLWNEGIIAYGIDFAPDLQEIWGEDDINLQIADAKKIPFADKTFDVVFSSDFFEHIPEDEIDQVLSEMKRVGKIIIACIAYEAKLTPRQALYHVTNKPKEWWVKRLPNVIITELYDKH